MGNGAGAWRDSLAQRRMAGYKPPRTERRRRLSLPAGIVMGTVISSFPQRQWDSRRCSVLLMACPFLESAVCLQTYTQYVVCYTQLDL